MPTLKPYLSHIELKSKGNIVISMFDFSLFAAELRKVHLWISYIVNISVKKLKIIKSSEESKNQFS